MAAGQRGESTVHSQFKRKFFIGDREMGAGCPVYIIAEAGVNHNGSLELALELVDAAAESGADAVKFQTFRTEELATRRAPKAAYHLETTGVAQSWFDLLKSQELDRADHESILRRCQDRGVTFLSTPYDAVSVDLLADLDVRAFKIASTDANNIPFLRYVAGMGRPVIISTAMCTFEEVQESVRAMAVEGLRELVVLQCTGSYPAPIGDTNMRAMVTMGTSLGIPFGYSDHTKEGVNPVLTVALGGCAYEAHLTLDRSLPGPDHRMSLEPEEMRATVDAIRNAEAAMGSPEKSVQPSEQDNRTVLRKSIVAIKPIGAGEIFTRETVGIRRPGSGLAPARYEAILGRRAGRDLAEEDVITPDCVEGGLDV
jgi:N,N'-diacetyllegionaminate synthase